MRHERIDRGRAESVDVKTRLRCKMQDPPADLRRTRGIRTAHRGFALQLHDLCPAGRAGPWKHVRLAPGLAFREIHAANRRDDFAGLLKVDEVADPEIQPRDHIAVVQGRPRHGASRDAHRRKFGHGREQASATDLHGDAEQLGLDPLRGELEGHRPARRAMGLARIAAPCHRIQLHNRAIGREGEIPARLPEFPHYRPHFVRPARDPVFLQGRQSPRPRLLVKAVLRGRSHRRRFPCAPTIKHDLQPSRRDFPRIEQSGRGGSQVARVCKQRLIGLFARLVDPGELGPRQVDLAAKFDEFRHRIRHSAGRHPAEFARQRTDRPSIGRDLVSLGPIAARDNADEPPVFVGNADREAIDLGFDHYRDVLPPDPPDKAAEERPQFRLGVSLVETRHWLDVATDREKTGAIVAHRQLWSAALAQLRKGGFKVCQFTLELVVGKIADLEIEGIVVRNHPTEQVAALPGLPERQDGGCGGRSGRRTSSGPRRRWRDPGRRQRTDE